MKQVALLAGVGTKTVSRVINDEPNVSDAMAKRVWEAVAALDYHVDMQAGSLRRAGGRTRTIGLLISSVDNPFAGGIHRAVETQARRHGVSVLAASMDEDPAREALGVTEFLRRRVDGLIITTASQDLSYLVSAAERGIPMVFVDRAPVGLKADAVTSDNRAAAAAGTRHLIDHGHRHIALLVDNVSIDTAAERRFGFLEELGRAGIPTGDATICTDVHGAEAAEQLVRSLLDQPDPPTAIFSAQNLITLGALRALHSLGRQHEVALIGFDDLPLADLLQPAITVISQDASAIGEAAAERLFRRLDGDHLPVEHVTVPARLIARGSGEIPPPNQRI
jgi:LacI family transcriptional regulator